MSSVVRSVQFTKNYYIGNKLVERVVNSDAYQIELVGNKVVIVADGRTYHVPLSMCVLEVS